MTHVDTALLSRYTTGDPGLDDATVWSIEVHLEACPDCRGHLAAGVPVETGDLLDRVFAGIDREITAGPAPARVPRPGVKRLRRLLAGPQLPWLVMTVAVVLIAGRLDGLFGEFPSLVLLIAPVAPVPAVAVAWTRRLDPAWELIAGMPSAGLQMLLRRTLAVLIVVTPVLTLAGPATGSSPALVLLPGLAFTIGTLALGSVIGVRRAALTVAAAWVAAIVVPATATAHLPAALGPDSAPVWVLITLALTAVVVLRAKSFQRLFSWR
jgi:hypothetical protein